MKKINNFSVIEQLIYEEQRSLKDNVWRLRFVQIKRSQADMFYYYDCLFANIILIERSKITTWKQRNLMLQDFPFCIDHIVETKNYPSFQKKEWLVAVENAKAMWGFLKKILTRTNLSEDVSSDLYCCIDNLNQFFGLHKINSDSIFTILSEATTNYHIIEEIDFYDSLSSPILFQELRFSNKQTNKTYILLEKIFCNFKLLSKYKMQKTYIQVKNIDQYLENHLKNIYFSQNFSIIDIEEETLAILNKINSYLTKEIDQYLEQCINEQLSLIDSIQARFEKVNLT